MSAVTLPQSLEEAHALIGQQRSAIEQQGSKIEQLQWRIGQLEKQLFGSTSDRVLSTEGLSKEQILLSLFPPPTEPPAPAEVAVEGLPASPEAVRPRRPARTPTARGLETVTEWIESLEKLCPHCEKSERFEYIPAKFIRHQIVRPKLACPCGQVGVSIAPLMRGKPPKKRERGSPDRLWPPASFVLKTWGIWVTLF